MYLVSVDMYEVSVEYRQHMYVVSGYGWSVLSTEWLRVECVDYGVATGGVCGLWSGYG